MELPVEELKPREICFNCSYWSNRGKTTENYGHCKRYAPKPINENKYSNQYTPTWPVMNFLEWCGEFKRFNIDIK